MVLVDSDVWSIALRRECPPENEYVKRLSVLIDKGEAALIGFVRQEILSGIRTKGQFEKLRKRMRAFPDEKIGPDLHELAAAFFNHCRARGVQGSHTDFLICACAVSWRVTILSNDFRNYSKYLPIELEIR
jgi:predicted nucleic acid-binding protein